MRTRSLLPIVAVLLACGSPTGANTPGLQILFIGNSLTFWNDMPGMVEWLIESTESDPATIEAVTAGGVGLEDHWRFGDALAAIRRGGWDVVIMQQGPSATEGRPSLLEYSARFAGEIEAVGACPALYMVWPDTLRFFDFDGVTDSYTTAARNVGGLLLPAGDAWRAAWARGTAVALYGNDGFHPSPAGSYLAALVMYARLTGRTPQGLAGTIPGDGDNLSPGGDVLVELDAPTAQLLQAAALDAAGAADASTASECWPPPTGVRPVGQDSSE